MNTSTKKKICFLLSVGMVSAFALVSCKEVAQTSGLPLSKDPSVEESVFASSSKKTVSPSFFKEEILLLQNNFQNEENYQSEITGTVTSSFYTQKIHDIHIKKGENAFLRAISSSKLVNVGKEVYFSKDRAVSRKAEDVEKKIWSHQFSLFSIEEFRNTNGSTPFELSNYLLNEETLLQGEVLENADGTFTVTASLDPQKATVLYGQKIKNYGNLSKNPVFTECTIHLHYTKDHRLLSIESFDHYKIVLGALKLSCTSHLTETFCYEHTGPIPNEELFEKELQK